MNIGFTDHNNRVIVTSDLGVLKTPEVVEDFFPIQASNTGKAWHIKSGKVVTVKIRDRGPYRKKKDGVTIDISCWAALRLGILNKGIARLRVTIKKIPE